MESRLQIGDVVFFRPSSFLSNLIGWFTKSDYSHVGLVVGEGTIIEADRFMKTKLRMLDGTEDISVYRVPNVTDRQKQAISLQALTYKGFGYDYFQILGTFIRLVFGRESSWFNAKNKLICSELIDLVFYVADIPRKLTRSIGDVTPEELFEVYELRKVFDSRNGTICYY